MNLMSVITYFVIGLLFRPTVKIIFNFVADFIWHMRANKCNPLLAFVYAIQDIQIF